MALHSEWIRKSHCGRCVARAVLRKAAPLMEKTQRETLSFRRDDLGGSAASRPVGFDGEETA